jgi:hypothetical protein
MKAASKKSSRTSAQSASEKSEFIHDLAALFALVYFKAPSAKRERAVKKLAKEAEELVQYLKMRFDKDSAADQAKIDKASDAIVEKLHAFVLSQTGGVCIGVMTDNPNTCESRGGTWIPGEKKGSGPLHGMIVS